ncbi:riboflavin synthase subunit alpha [Spirochaetia bacterium]|nr:riboflavin synthase subunit alpha [Spirochaetia bacterium]
MFTGIVEEMGTVLAVVRETGRTRLTIAAERVLEGTGLGDSINIEGVCQTVADLDKNSFSVFTLAESLRKTTLGLLRPGDRVNLERALRPDSRMGGHMVQGHVSCTVPIRELRRESGNVYLSVEIPEEQIRYCVAEGSIALDGVSLTIAEIRGRLVRVNIIPGTFGGTTLGYKKTGGLMNLETDIIGRYVERLLARGAPDAGKLSAERLIELGY